MVRKRLSPARARGSGAHVQRPSPVRPSLSPGRDPGASTGATGARNEQTAFHATSVTPTVATTPLNGDEMTTETQSQPQSQDRDREATTGRFPLALFVVAELLCTGVLVASVILWT